MLFEERNNLFHWFNLIESSVFDHLNISKVSHDSHEEFFVGFLFSSLWKNFDTGWNFFNEGFNVLDFLNSVVKEEGCEAVNPISNGVLELFDKRSSVNSQPSNINCLLKCVDIISGSVQRGNGLIENLKTWSSSGNTTKNFDSHLAESLIDFFFSIIIDIDVLLFSWIFSCVQEVLETLWKSFFPEELFVFVLINEFFGGILNVNEVLWESLESSI